MLATHSAVIRKGKLWPEKKGRKEHVADAGISDSVPKFSVVKAGGAS
jgi:hypothetical protein